jgi:hypothetical protein
MTVAHVEAGPRKVRRTRRGEHLRSNPVPSTVTAFDESRVIEWRHPFGTLQERNP